MGVPMGFLFLLYLMRRNRATGKQTKRSILQTENVDRGVFGTLPMVQINSSTLTTEWVFCFRDRTSCFSRGVLNMAVK